MFQDFSAPSTTAADPERIARLRSKMKEAGSVGFLIPRADEHQGEYVPPSSERLAWLTGFKGSAGLAVVLKDEAAIFVDGRYTLQVRDQVQTDILTPINIHDQSPGDWLEEKLKPGQKLAYDPWLHTIDEIQKYTKMAKKVGATLVATDNLVDAIWDNQPAPPVGKVTIHPLELAGRPSNEKIIEVQNALHDMSASAFLLTQPDSICWLLNIRGSDVPHTPLALGFAILHADAKPDLFIDTAKLNAEFNASLSAHVNVQNPDSLLDHIGKITGTLALDPATTSVIFKSHCDSFNVSTVEKSDPCILPKATKNPAELQGSRNAHIRDGVAICRFLAWISRQPTNTLDEIVAARQLEDIRRQEGEHDGFPLADISFDTISGFGPNGAIVHYRVTEATNASFADNALYLVDSGGQYQDGTTDITRTVAIGVPTHDMKRHFTLVLKGMIAISRLQFPKGTNGAQIDAFARLPLWQAGLDFDHGTGHGVGSFLSVHEGPQRISKISKVAFKPGMIVSNEPGFYKTGAYGIRIENLLVVDEMREIAGGERPMMSFETLTFAPIDRNLIDLSLLDDGERDWLNKYHAEVFSKLNSRLNDADKDWLKAATKAL